ncbi:MAG: IclR family transcriptional regulator [Chloroflexi bacterium]|nr:IclR family transcriptional regulator [Chloroflexota bacterium]
MPTMVSAVERAIQILKAFETNDEYSFTELHTLLSLNKSTAHDILRTLSEHRFLLRNEKTRRYRLGPALIRLGHLAHEQIDVRQIARPYMESLMQQTEKSVLLGTFYQNQITIVDKVDPVGTLHVSTAIGQQIPVTAGSFGKVFFAWKSEEEVERLLTKAGLRWFTPTSIIDPAVYKDELAKVRQQGYAIDDQEEYLLGVKAITVPLKNYKEVVAAMTIVGFTSRSVGEPSEETIMAVIQAATEISKQLGNNK